MEISWHLTRWQWSLSAEQLSQQRCRNASRMVWKTQHPVWGVDFAPIFCRSRSNRVYVGCSEETTLIQGGPTSSLLGFKEPATDGPARQTADLQRPTGVHAWTWFRVVGVVTANWWIMTKVQFVNSMEITNNVYPPRLLETPGTFLALSHAKTS